MEKKILSAQDGFFVCHPISRQGKITAFRRDPVIAWRIEETSNGISEPIISVDAITTTGECGDDTLLQKPDGSYEIQFVEIFGNESEALEFFNQTRNGIDNDPL